MQAVWFHIAATVETSHPLSLPETTTPILRLPTLKSGVVHLWTAWIGGPFPSAAVLSSDESARAARFVFDRDRNRYVACRSTLRRLLAHYLEVKPAAVRFQYTPHGKPRVPETGGRQLEFNLSHSEDWALIGATVGHRLGVDLERLRPLHDLEGLARSCFSSQERADLAGAPADRKSEAFLNCWTRKEAFVKACGEGLSHPLKDFDVTLLPGQRAAILSIRSQEGSTESWSLTDLRVLPGFVGAAAVECDGAVFEFAGRLDLPPRVGLIPDS